MNIEEMKMARIRETDEAFLVVNDSSLMRHEDPLMPEGVRVVIAQASTGSRYVVIVSDLGPFASSLGGDRLVSVISPWQASYPLQAGGGIITMEYAGEKFGRGHQNYWGDMWALTRTIAYALDRQAYCPGLEAGIQ